MLQKIFNVVATIAIIALILVMVDHDRQIGSIDKLAKRATTIYTVGAGGIGAACSSTDCRTVGAGGIGAANRPVKARASTWPALGQDKTIAIGERLQALNSKTSVTIYCSSTDCRDVQHDLDDAFQIADWPSEFENGAFMPPEEPGIFVGPPGEKATALQKALAPTFGPVGIIDMRPQTSDVGVMFGKRPKAVSGAFGFK